MAKTFHGDPYENLANAIIIQAAEDYKTALGRINRNPDNWLAIDEASRIERFFHSRWYGALTTLDGDLLINRLREEVLK